MSRIGKKAVGIPDGVKVSVSANEVHASGPKGEKNLVLHPDVEVVEEENTLQVRLKKEGKGENRAIWGTMRARLAALLEGVNTGFTRVLELHGIGFRAAKSGEALQMSLGFSHPVMYDIPKGVDCKVERSTIITLSGNDKELVGQAAASLKALRPPDVYQNKGIRYQGERLRKKAGKSGSKG